MTKQQELILRLVHTSCAHCTADEIFAKAKEEMPSIGLATVYRNLNQLSADGKIRRVLTVGEPDRFDKTLIQHEHAVCKVCGCMRDVEVTGISQQIQKGLETNDFTYELSIHELCPKCKKALEEQLGA